MSTRTCLFALTVFSALVTGACATAKPSLTFQSMNLQGVDLEGATLELTYALKNPNPIGATLSRVNYALEVEGKSLVSGKPANGMKLPASGTTMLRFPARVHFAQLVPSIGALASKGSASYRAKGAVGVKTPIGVIDLPISKSGVFALPKLPTFSMGAPQIEELSLTGARLTIPMNISNSNAFALVADGLKGEVSIGGTKVGSTEVRLASPLGANATQTIALPIEIDFLSSGTAVAKLLKGGKAQVALNGSFDSGNASVPVALNQLLEFVR